ncbi:hypothetical protein EMCRGX_G007713 [Ephydatia muelleri]
MNCCAFVESSPLHTLKSVDKEESTIQLGYQQGGYQQGPPAYYGGIQQQTTTVIVGQPTISRVTTVFRSSSDHYLTLSIVMTVLCVFFGGLLPAVLTLVALFLSLSIVVPLPIWSVFDRLIKEWMPSPDQLMSRLIGWNVGSKLRFLTVYSLTLKKPKNPRHVTQHFQSQWQSCRLVVNGSLEALETLDGKSQHRFPGSRTLVPKGVV